MTNVSWSASTLNQRRGETLIESENVTDSLAAYDAVAAAHDNVRYSLCLYVTGTAARSLAAIANIRKICDAYLSGRYDLDVIDISLQPSIAKGEQIIAAPTLIKKLPLPARRFVGDMSHTERILRGLDLRSSAACENPTQVTSCVDQCRGSK